MSLRSLLCFDVPLMNRLSDRNVFCPLSCLAGQLKPALPKTTGEQPSSSGDETTQTKHDATNVGSGHA